MDIILPGKKPLVAPSALVQAIQRLGAEAVKQVFLDILAKSLGKLTYTEIVTASDFNKSSTHRILLILMGQDLVHFNEQDKSYFAEKKRLDWARSA